MNSTEITASNDAFIKAWRYWSDRSPAGTVAHLDGVIAPWMNHTWPICNLSFLADEVRDEADLTRRIEAALAHAQTRQLGWIFFVSADFLPAALRPRMEAIFARYALTAGFTMTGMASEALLPPRRTLPTLDIRPVNDAANRSAVGEINCQGYHMPEEWGIEALNVAPLWETPPAYGYVAYLDGQPVSCAKTVVLDDYLYVGLVATRPGHQGHGYGEAVMRHSITQAQQACGLQRIVLHATDQGLPLYQAMGFHTITPFQGFMLPHEE